jgi:uncharacterized protein
MRPQVAFIVGLIGAVVAAACPARAQASAAAPIFTYQEVMIPMRDGIRLQTVILTPVAVSAALPMLLSRSPYGVPAKAPDSIPAYQRVLAQDGYIFVLQNVRGRFKSQGTFSVSTLAGTSDPKAVNDTTDAYDTIDWLVKNVPGNNGKVGMYGISYAGLTAALALLHPHPALKAVSEQGASADEWMNDDFHRFGALRESYAFEYAVSEEADKYSNTSFNFETDDTYQWYLDLGPLSNVNARYLHGSLSFWNELVDHPDYDAYWKKEAWIHELHGSIVPVLNVAGFWDQEDPWGPWQIFRKAGTLGGGRANFMVAGPWCHGCWAREAKGEAIGPLTLGGHETSREFREDIEAPFFRYYLHGSGQKPEWRVKTFQTGSNRWQTYSAWPPANSRAVNLYLQWDGSLSFDRPSAQAASYREYVSDPADPVPYRQRPISPISSGRDWSIWEVSDQRFVEHRPDVLTYISAPLDHALTVSGTVAAELYASTTGSDCDWVVKLIDVFPENAVAKAGPSHAAPEADEHSRTSNGYELPIAMEIRRGRYNESFEHPAPLTPNQPTRWQVPLRDHDHVFAKGHRVMVQVQSTWFPLIDRNPQTFVPNIYLAQPGDFVKARQRIYSSPALPSHIVLPLIR